MITFALANYIEAGLWMAIGVGFILFRRRDETKDGLLAASIHEQDPHPASPVSTRERGKKAPVFTSYFRLRTWARLPHFVRSFSSDS